MIQFFKSLTIFILINGVLHLSSQTYRSLLLRSIYRFEVLSTSLNDVNFSNNQENSSFNKRLEYLIFSKTKIFENKNSLILGYGLGSFSNEYDQTDRRLYPHNIIVEIVFELGLIGLLLALAFLISNSSSYKGFFTNLALMAAITLLINSMKSSSLVDLRLLFALLSISIFHFNKLTLKKLIKVCHLTSVHQRDDTRIFLKECMSLSMNYNVSVVIADNLGNELKNKINIFDVGKSNGRFKDF